MRQFGLLFHRPGQRRADESGAGPIVLSGSERALPGDDPANYPFQAPERRTGGACLQSPLLFGLSCPCEIPLILV
ncbi:hypothetical protein SKAU_G00401820 [Synaphobranchus kaupii]|uniref:Uncharacterized protein n=1 Tax=Synaphobranchus kaupii TaxID=118154 RepID=A0A9Q1IAF5_SYNKA|nr:hypothetical protein SKAU_G00401820 [Synaphobranchus kaupii]